MSEQKYRIRHMLLDFIGISLFLLFLLYIPALLHLSYTGSMMEF